MDHLARNSLGFEFAHVQVGNCMPWRNVIWSGRYPAIAQRVDFADHRVLEELYHVASDPDCLKNLIDDPEHQQAADRVLITEIGDMTWTSSSHFENIAVEGSRLAP